MDQSDQTAGVWGGTGCFSSGPLARQQAGRLAPIAQPALGTDGAGFVCIELALDQRRERSRLGFPGQTWQVAGTVFAGDAGSLCTRGAAGHRLIRSWIEATGLPMQWLFTRAWGVIPGVVFTSYLDQSIIFAASAAVLWHLRSEGFVPVWLMVALALSMLANVVFLLPGRTGYLVVILVLTLAAMWALPQRWRLAAFLVIPLLTLVALWFGSPKIQARLSLVYTESQAFSVTSNPGSSAGFRLHAWKRSLQAIGEEPGKGFGVGGWTATVRRLEGPTADEVFGTGKMSNPHQEYLLWGVELGLVGLLLLPALVVALVRDFGRFAPPIARAGQSLALAMALACLFNSSLYDGLIGDYFCVLLGLLLAYGLALQNGPIRDLKPL